MNVRAPVFRRRSSNDPALPLTVATYDQLHRLGSLAPDVDSYKRVR